MRTIPLKEKFVIIYNVKIKTYLQVTDYNDCIIIYTVHVFYYLVLYNILYFQFHVVSVHRYIKNRGNECIIVYLKNFFLWYILYQHKSTCLSYYYQ